MSKLPASLPYGFNGRVMELIRLEVERKNRRSYIGGIILAATTALALLGSLILVLSRYYDFQQVCNLLKINLPGFNNPFIYYMAIFSSLVLILLTLDLTLRQLWKR